MQRAGTATILRITKNNRFSTHSYQISFIDLLAQKNLIDNNTKGACFSKLKKNSTSFSRSPKNLNQSIKTSHSESITIIYFDVFICSVLYFAPNRKKSLLAAIPIKITLFPWFCFGRAQYWLFSNFAKKKNSKAKTKIKLVVQFCDDDWSRIANAATIFIHLRRICEKMI